MHKGSLFFPSLPAVVTASLLVWSSSLFDGSHSNGCEVIELIMVLIGISLMTCGGEHFFFFNVSVGHLYVSFGKMPPQILWAFLNHIFKILYFAVELYKI